MAALHVAQLNFQRAPAAFSSGELLENWPSLADVADAVAGTGIRVSVLQAAVYTECLQRNGGDYHFVDVTGAEDATGESRRFANRLAELQPDVLHVHGLIFAGHACAVSGLLPQPPPILLQDHADRAPPWWRRKQWSRYFAAASGVSFTALDQAKPFADAGLFAASLRRFEIPESSSRFTRGSRVRARSETGLHGDPCVLWVGHLNRSKDPLTMLEGVARAARKLPALRLWCAFGTAVMLEEVQARARRDPRLAGRVHLLGKVTHARVEALMRAADLYVSASLSEGSGYALLEAMACGVYPVITDIPAHRALTGSGHAGRLWPCRDPDRLAEALVSAARNRLSPEQMRDYFDHELSFATVGRRLAGAYAQLLDDRLRRTA
ncbi:MAG: glycosyltransferase family 4 protein [Rhodanobacteraceae bacterium]